MLLDATLAALHYLSIFLLIVFLAGEAVLCKPEHVSAATIRRLGIYDRLCFAFAMAVLVSGLARVFFGVKGAAYYTGNLYFWAKVATFVVIALMSIPPTCAFAGWRQQLTLDADALPAPAQITAARTCIMRQAHVLALLPVFAVLMARGYGRL